MEYYLKSHMVLPYPPSQQDTLTQCWFNDGPSSEKLGQHVYRVRYIPANTTRWPNAGTIVSHRLRRWANISPAVGQRVVFTCCYDLLSRFAQNVLPLIVPPGRQC